MSSVEETAAAELAARHEDARAKAYTWAERATTEYGQAVEYEDRGRELARQPFQTGAAEKQQRNARQHGVRSAEALRLAEMWARVAAVLVPPLEPVWSTLESTDAQDHH